MGEDPGVALRLTPSLMWQQLPNIYSASGQSEDGEQCNPIGKAEKQPECLVMPLYLQHPHLQQANPPRH